MTLFLTACTAFIIGAIFYHLLQKYRLTTLRELSKEIMNAAEKNAQKIQENAKLQVKEQQIKSERANLKLEHSLQQKEDKLNRKLEEALQKLAEVEKREKQLRTKLTQVEKQEQEAKNCLLQIANMTQEEAKRELLQKTELLIEKERRELFAKKLKQVQEEVEEETKRLFTIAIERLSCAHSPHTHLDYLQLKSEELKARIIGRDGRNIKCFEQLAGVSIIIDDSPEVIIISAFDPERRYIAKMALKVLVEDSRIHPNRIEEVLKKAKETFDFELLQLGQKAAAVAQVDDLNPEILRLLGKLHFRTSLGQNVLEHSVEVSHLMGLLAAELTLDEKRARRIGLLHDMGKALAAESGLSHAIAGMQFALKFGETEVVANGIGCHHDEIAAKTFEASLCKSADRLSATRSGARTNAQAEKQISRLKNLEELARQFSGVEEAYAVQAGRELRVLVKPEVIDDLQATELAQALSKKIEETQGGSGKIQITIIRQTKIVEFASKRA